MPTSRINPPTQHGTNPIARGSRVGVRKLGIVVLMAGLVSLAALAKFNFALPQSTPSHWMSQTCKMHQSRRSAWAHEASARAFAPGRRADQPRPRPMALRGDDRATIAAPGFFRHAPLRAPPAV